MSETKQTVSLSYQESYKIKSLSMLTTNNILQYFEYMYVEFSSSCCLNKTVCYRFVCVCEIFVLFLIILTREISEITAITNDSHTSNLHKSQSQMASCP